MLEVFLIAQCSLTLPDGRIESFKFCGTTPISVPPKSVPNTVKPSEYSEPVDSFQESNVPVSYRYLTQDNYHKWEALVKEFDPISGHSRATLGTAQSLFGFGKVIQKKGQEMKKFQWKESNRSIDAWFDGRTLMTWKARGFN
ncbi:MAG TPA: hypothetical protein DCF68_06595 [Cyanothece sp. UBA12306]|nr:hypothetical protein [Cyanothece sp. UBA12306]